MNQTVEITKIEFHRDKEPPMAIAHGFLRVSPTICIQFQQILGAEEVAALDSLLEETREEIRRTTGAAMRLRISPVRWGSAIGRDEE